MPSLGRGFYFPEKARIRVSAGSYSGLDAFSVVRGTAAEWMEGVAVVGSKNIAYCIKLHSARRRLHFLENSMMRAGSRETVCVRKRACVCGCVGVACFRSVPPIPAQSFVHSTRVIYG